MVSYNDVKILPGIILDYDEKEDEYCVRSDDLWCIWVLFLALQL